MKKKYCLLILSITTLILCIIIPCVFMLNKYPTILFVNNKKNNKTEYINNEKKTITLSAVGDCTLGYDSKFGYTNSFNHYYDRYGAKYFFENVEDIFKEDDITFANLESTFTDSNNKKPKKFNFKAPAEFVEILKVANIDTVNISNNHTLDYYYEGFEDTVKTLDNAGIRYSGMSYYDVFEEKGISFGIAGIHCIENLSCKAKIDDALDELNKRNAQIKILSFHWGIEGSHRQSKIQTILGRYAIDNGAELILGHHPHVLQGIELYKDKYIVYSLANFSFGGNKNPKDKDTMVFQIQFTFDDKNNIKSRDVNVIPMLISSNKKRNDYKPMIATGDDEIRIRKKINDTSINFKI